MADDRIRKIERIPVFLSMSNSIHHSDPVGWGKIEDGKLIIEVDGPILVDSIKSLVAAEHIKELYLGLGYPIGPVEPFVSEMP